MLIVNHTITVCVSVSDLELHISLASGVPRYRQIVDQVTDLVRSGRLSVGAQLPSVRELARTLVVSLVTVRRAYADLEVAGLIVRRQGQGTYVTEHGETRSQKALAREAEQVVASALERARHLGLDEKELAALVHRLLSRKGRR